MISFEYLTMTHFSQSLEITESCWVTMVVVKSCDSETRFYSTHLILDFDSSELVYQGKSLKYFFHFKIKDVPMMFIILDKDYTKIDAEKHIFLHFQDEPPKSCRCEFQSLALRIGEYGAFPPNSCFKKGLKLNEIGYSWGKLINTEDKLKRFSGTFKIAIEVGNGHLLKEKFIREFNPLTISDNSEEITFICSDDEKVTLDKALLCKISNVFQTMLENTNTSESQSNIVNLKDVASQTVKAFKNVLLNNIVDTKDLSVDLLMFADKYNIQPLVSLCLDHLRENVSKENFMDIVKAAEVMKDQDLLEAAAKFAYLNVGKFQMDSEAQDFIMANSQCFANIWIIMMTMSFKM